MTRKDDWLKIHPTTGTRERPQTLTMKDKVPSAMPSERKFAKGWRSVQFDKSLLKVIKESVYLA